MTRITQQSNLALMRNDLSVVSKRLADIQRQVASGKTLQRASDEPSAALESLRYRRSLRTYGQYERNLTDARNWLGNADTAMEAMDNRLSRVQELTIQADNGSLSPAARTAISTELRSVADEMLGLMNSDHLGRPLFGGNVGGSEAYDDAGAYLGDNGVVERTISSGSAFQVNVTGPDAFGADNPADPLNGNIVEMVRRIADDVDAGVQVQDTLDNIDAAQTRLHSAQATLGARLSSIEKLESRNLETTTDLRSSLSRTEDVDLTEAILELTSQEAAYTAALNVSGRLLSNSLLDFIR
ncbi:MAG: flagellar hook-associated protein FlgL [Actinomycetota bacterium]